MKYWERVKLNNLEVIQSKSLEYIKNNKHQLSYGTPFNPLDFKGFIQAVPELVTSFAEHGLTPINVSAYIMLSNTDGGAHRDALTECARINIPILNCENSWTNFYNPVRADVKPKLMVNAKGMPYKMYLAEDLVLVDRVQITEPTVIRPLEIHSIEMDETKVPRITLTISTNPVPEFLLGETKD